MAIQPVLGPASGGKSQWVAQRLLPGWVIIDYTALYAALSGVQRGSDGKFPERVTGDPLLPMISSVKAVALSMAVERGLSGFVTSSARADREVLERITGQAAMVIDPGEEVIRARLSDPLTGELSPECSTALSRWYR